MERSINKRDTNIDVVKGIAIIMMVALHAGGPFSDFINLFHMAVFLMASGYFWNEKKVETTDKTRHWLIGKLKSIWLPFVLINVLLNISNNLLINLNLYTSNPAFYNIEEIYQGNYLHYKKSVAQILISCIKNLFFLERAQLATPTWFLGVLFFTVLVRAILDFILHSFKATEKTKSTVHLITFLLSLAGAWVVSVCSIDMPAQMHVIFALYAAYSIGYYLNKIDFKNIFMNKPWVVFVSSFALLLILCKYGEISLYNGNITNPLYYVFASLLGWMFLYSISCILPRWPGQVLQYIGRHTMSILLLHCLSFKLISLLYIFLNKKDIVLLAVFPSIRNVDYLWLFYLVIGVAFPLSVSDIFAYLKRRFRYTGLIMLSKVKRDDNGNYKSFD